MRELIRLNDKWQFHLGEKENGWFKGYDDRAWQTVTLPHDWSVSQPFDEACSSGTGYLPGGIGWYRKRFTLSDIKDDKVFITFGGVYQHAKVWINSNYLGMRAYGYSSFTYDITEFITQGENVLAVRCEHVQLADSRWFTGNGIYRDVTLTICSPAHLIHHEVYAYTESADQNNAVISVQAKTTDGAKASFALLDAGGQTVAEGDTTLYVTAPHLWSPETPYLYSLIAAAHKDGVETDRVTIPFGIRSFRFDANEGFFLNGVNRKLKGVCVHHDAGVLGAAVPKEVWRRRLLKLKEAGTNAIRCSHNPPDTHLLDLCDELGFLAIDEAFDEWEGCKNKWWHGHNVYPPKLHGYSEDFPQWYQQDLAEMVRRDRNHPSVILWSIGNEIDYPNDPYVHPLFELARGNNDQDKPQQELLYNPDKPNVERLTTIAKELVALVKELDSSRPVTAALAMPEISNLIGYAQALDVAGYNYKEELYQEDHEKYPNHILMGSENRHEPEAWFAAKNNPYISGQFIWTGVDFLGEAMGWPQRMSENGLLNAAGFEKPLFALRKVLWTEKLMTKLVIRKSDTYWDAESIWAGTDGEMKEVVVFTNGESATLSLNGETISAQSVDENCTAIFRVPFHSGVLKVNSGRGEETAEDVLITPGKAVTLEAVNVSEAADEMQQIEVILRDAQGLIAATDDRVLTCCVMGDGKFMGIENGCGCDLTSYASTSRPTYQGRAIVYIRKTGKAEVRLSVPDMKAVVVRV